MNDPGHSKPYQASVRNELHALSADHRARFQKHFSNGKWVEALVRNHYTGTPPETSLLGAPHYNDPMPKTNPSETLSMAERYKHSDTKPSSRIYVVIKTCV